MVVAVALCAGVLPFVAGLVHALGHRMAAAMLSIDARVGLGLGPVWWRPRGVPFGVLPGVCCRPDISGTSGWRRVAYYASGPLVSIVAAWFALFVGYLGMGLGGLAAAHTATAWMGVVFDTLWTLVSGRFDPTAVMAAGGGDELAPWIASFATMSTLLAIYNVLPLPGSDLTSALTTWLERLLGRSLPIAIVYGGLGIAAVVALFVSVLVGDLVRFANYP